MVRPEGDRRRARSHRTLNSPPYVVTDESDIGDPVPVFFQKFLGIWPSRYDQLCGALPQQNRTASCGRARRHLSEAPAGNEILSRSPLVTGVKFYVRNALRGHRTTSGLAVACRDAHFLLGCALPALS